MMKVMKIMQSICSDEYVNYNNFEVSNVFDPDYN